MAVIQLRNGIYVNSIETVPDADQTAAYKYASLFTKHRKENWEMAQKQAASEIADAKARDAALLDVYGQQLQDYNDRLKQLDLDIARAGTDVAKANAATQRTALQEATATAQQKQNWALKKAEQVSVSGGSRSRSESESKGGGGTGGGGSSAKKSADDLVNVEIGNQGDGGRDPSALQEGLKQGALKSANISNTDPAVVSAAKAGGVAASVGLLATDYRNGGYSESDALAAAEADVFQDLTDNNHLDAVDAYKKAKTVDLAGGGGRTSRTESSSSRDPSTLQPRYKDLGEMPTADKVTAPVVAVDTVALEDKRKELAGQLADLIKQGAPASTVDDFITRSREIMAGRFGSPQVSPNFYQRNAASAPISALDQAYAKYKGLAPSFMQTDVGAVPTTAGTVAQSSPVTPGATQTAAPIVTGGSTPTVSPGASGEAPATAASSAAEAAAAGGASPTVVGAAAGAAAAAVPTGADAVRAVENKRLGNYPVRQKELDALFPEGVPQEVLDAAAGIKKSTPGSVERPQMQAPTGTTGTLSMPARDSVYFPTTATGIGRKPEVAGDFNVPDVQSKSVPPPPGDLWMPTPQPGGTFKNEFKGYVEPSEEEKKQIQDILQKKREKREAPVGKSGYFQQRFQSAKEIIDQPGKLARLTASGPGKVAADVYNANKASGKDFKQTYETLTATYEDDKEALAVAHQIALALDITARNKTAPPKA